MCRAAMLLTAVLAVSVAWAQTSTYPAPAPQNPSAGTASPGQNPTNPTNPSTQMPPDSKAPPPQASAPPSSPGATTNSPGGQVAAGTELHATLDAPLSSRTAHAGDTFTATVAEAVRDARGLVVLPAGAKVRGEVVSGETTEKAEAAVRSANKLSLHFRDVMLPGGTSTPLNATLVAVRQAKPMAKAAAEESGAEFPQVSVGARSAITSSAHAVTLPPDTLLVLRLDQPVSVPGR